jgi:hypothetical protein
LGDGRKELRLVCEGFLKVHEAIISHLAAICRTQEPASLS